MTKRRQLNFILATILIDAIGIGIVFPILPDLMERVGAESTAAGSVWGGILLAAYAGTQFLFAPAIGGLSDAYGRKPILVFALVVLAIDYVIMALAGVFWVLLVGRLIAGIAGATYITATAYLADISDKTERAANFGLIGAAFGIGFVLGPVIGGLAAAIHITAPFWIAAVLSAVAALFGWLALPESLPPEKRRPFSRRDLNPFRAILDAAKLPGLGLPLALIFIVEFANMVYPTLWAFWSREMFGWSATAIGLSLAAYGVGIAFTQGVLMQRIVPRFGEYRTLVFALVCGVVAFICFGLAGAAWVVFAVLPLACLADMAPPTITAISANLVDDDRQGVLQGVIASLASVAAIVAPLLVTTLFEATADDQGFYLPGAPYLAAALLILALFPFLPRLRYADTRKP